MTPVATVLPLLVGAGAVGATLGVHALALLATVRLLHGQAVGERTPDLGIAMATLVIALIAHLVAIGLWASVLVAIDEFQWFGQAFYHSAMNYTTLGYGDVVMSPAWRLLGPIEAIAGLLMFGVSTAAIFAVIARLAETRSERTS